MDGSASSGVTVRDSTDGTLVPERATWNADRTVLTLNPTARMQSETKYVITVDKGLGAARGGVLAQPRTSSFTTVGAPRVSQTYPANGQKDAGRYGVSLQFASPMEPDSLEGRIHISGISDKDLEGKVYTYAFGLSASLTLEASHSYTVTFDAGAKDQYGQVMGAYTFSFTTGSLPSTVAFALPGYQGATYSSSTEPVLWYWTTNKSEVRFTLYPLTTAADPSRASPSTPAAVKRSRTRKVSRRSRCRRPCPARASIAAPGCGPTRGASACCRPTGNRCRPTSSAFRANTGRASTSATYTPTGRSTGPARPSSTRASCAPTTMRSTPYRPGMASAT